VTPAVGIPLCLDASGRIRPGRTYQYLDAAYARAIERAGGTAVFLPIQSGVGELVRRIDALVIPGGDDFLPLRPYPPHVRFDPVPEAQLAFDRALLGEALGRELPVFGICYGMQLLALTLGGKLHYDIETDVAGARSHKLAGAEEQHRLRLAPDSRLAALAGASELSVGSRHHQAVSEPGAKLVVSARAEDGVIEAVELRGARFCLGVQWHPESQDDPLSGALFRALVDAGRS
jgi:gamma-glutamyl-gamma-aminobutyrate hydrolase PuuD